MNRIIQPFLLSAALLLLTFALPLRADEAKYQIIMPTGAEIPGLTSNVTTVYRVIINAKGQIAAFLTAGADTVLVRFDGNKPTVLVRQARPRDAGHKGQAYMLQPLNLDVTGRVLFEGTIADIPDPMANGRAYLRSDGDKVDELARLWTPAAEHLTICQLATPVTYACNDKGLIIFEGLVQSRDDKTAAKIPAVMRGLEDGAAIVAQVRQPIANYDPEPIRQVAPVKPVVTPKTTISADPVPVVWNAFESAVALNGRGDMALSAQVSGLPPEKNDGVFLITENATRFIAQVSTPIDDKRVLGPGAHDLAINERNQVAFVAPLRNADGGETRSEGVFLADAQGVRLLAESRTAPPGLEEHMNRFAATAINAAGQVAFRAQLGRPDPKQKERPVILLHDGQALKTLAAFDQKTPDGQWKYETLGNPVINDSGQVAFTARLVDLRGIHVCNAIFCYDPIGGLLTVARTGQKIGDEEIKNLDFAAGPVGGGAGFNHFGQLAFITDHRAIILWTAPNAPTTQKQ